jgi:hypothetical protein
MEETDWPDFSQFEGLFEMKKKGLCDASCGKKRCTLIANGRLCGGV